MIAKLKLIQINTRVTYYSVTLLENDDSLITKNGSMFEDFKKNHETVCIEKLDYIISSINLIGDVKGALDKYFRFENDASALPSPTKIAKEELISIINNDIEVTGFDLRLYCLRLNDNVVILFNGGIKITDYPQDCPNVSGHFRQACILSKMITDAIANKEIEVSEDDILYDDDFEIIF